MTDPYGQCGWVYWVEEGGDGSQCPEPATVLVRVVPEGGVMPANGGFCAEHAEAGTERLRHLPIQRGTGGSIGEDLTATDGE